MKTRIIGDSSTKTQESVDEVVAKLVVVDGLSFNQIAISSLIKPAFKADGILLPSSPSQIKVLFMKHFQDLKSKITKKIVEIKECSGCFSINFDESTSTINRRFINLKLHFSTDLQSLIRGKDEHRKIDSACQREAQ